MSFYKKREFNRRKDSAFLSIISIFLSLYTAFSVVSFSAGAESVRGSVVRLHILANSDSAVDQNIKIKVRNTLLEKGVLEGECETAEAAAEYYCKNTDELKKIAESVLKENNKDYGARVIIGKEYYKTRRYGDLTFPAGVYESVRVILGEGKGENWWCVMFPPLCIPVADGVEGDKKKAEKYLTKKGEEIVCGDYVVKFKLLEIYEELKSKTRE